MADAVHCNTGDWVEVERVLLEPEERASNLPPDTASKPLLIWVKGFATVHATVGGAVTVETMTGRIVTGRLSAINPGYFHTFGRPIPELVHVGADLRARLVEYRGGDADASSADRAAAVGAPVAAVGAPVAAEPTPAPARKAGE